MTITIATASLIGLLTDALHAVETDPEEFAPGVHFATHRDGFGDEPGMVDLLAVTSTNRFVVGHAFDAVHGQVTPSVWPVDATKTVLAICKNLLAVRGKEHTVDVEVVEQVPDNTPPGEDAPAHPGYLVSLTETPALFDTDTEFSFHADHEAKFPVAGMRRVLTGGISDTEQEKGPIAESLETLWSPHVLAPLVAIAKRRKEQLRVYRSPGRRAHVVQIGGTWLGAAMAASALPGEERDEPSIEPLLQGAGVTV